MVPLSVSMNFDIANLHWNLQLFGWVTVFQIQALFLSVHTLDNSPYQ